MRLLRLKEIEIPDAWPTIKYMLIKSFPDLHEVYFENMLDALLRGWLDVWVLLEKREERWVGVGMVATVDVEDTISQRKFLSIYALAGWDLLSDAHWEHGFERLRAYARGMGQMKIVSASKNPRVLRLMERWGVDTSYRTLEMGVD